MRSGQALEKIRKNINTLWWKKHSDRQNSVDNELVIFVLFFTENILDISFILSFWATTWLFS